MTNKTIALIFVGLAWLLFVASVAVEVPLFIFYSVIAIVLAHIVHRRQT